MNKNKVLVIGLDGATFDVILPMIEKGKLPTLKKLMENGAWGRLESTVPYITAPAWTSAVTGVNPGKHGLYNFILLRGYEIKMADASFRKRSTLWNILSEYDKKVGIFNVPVTYPPEKVNGFMVSGWLTPSIRKDFTYPKELKSEILELIPNYQFKNLGPNSVGLKKAKKDVLEILKNRFILAKHLIKKEWDFFMGVFMASDQISHFLWGKPDIEEVYERLDEILSELVAMCGENTTIFVISDHGITKIEKLINIYSLLKTLGLSGRGKTPIPHKILRRFGITTGRTYGLFLKLGVRDTSFIPEKAKKMIPKSKLTHQIKYNIKEMKAFYYSWGLRINLKDREPFGLIEPEDYENFRENLIRKLKKIRDPETSERIFDKVFKREELYHGKYFEYAPDIVFLLKDGYLYTTKEDRELVLKDLEYTIGNHQINGIFIAYGKDIRKIQLEPKIIDVMPTILHIMGVPIPDDVDGRVLREIFKKDSEIYKREIKYEKSKEIEREKHEFSDEDEKVVRERLKGLGYLE
ncbi:MAG: alkaline phosphatase family protein [Candidatus Methanofastidiosia archaeon]